MVNNKQTHANHQDTAVKSQAHECSLNSDAAVEFGASFNCALIKPQAEATTNSGENRIIRGCSHSS